MEPMQIDQKKKKETRNPQTLKINKGTEFCQTKDEKSKRNYW